MGWLKHGEVQTTDESGMDWALTYEFDGDLYPVNWYCMGFITTEVPDVIEAKLVDMAYDDERERREHGSIYREECDEQTERT